MRDLADRPAPGVGPRGPGLEHAARRSERRRAEPLRDRRAQLRAQDDLELVGLVERDQDDLVRHVEVHDLRELRVGQRLIELHLRGGLRLVGLELAGVAATDQVGGELVPAHAIRRDR